VKLATAIDDDLIKPQADGETVCITQRHDEPEPLELTLGDLRDLGGMAGRRAHRWHVHQAQVLTWYK